MTICLKTGSDCPTLAKPFAQDRLSSEEWVALLLLSPGRALITGLNFRASFVVIHQTACFFNGKCSMPVLFL